MRWLDGITDSMVVSLRCKKAKWLSGEALQRAVKRREAKSKGEKERYKHMNAEFHGKQAGGTGHWAIVQPGAEQRRRGLLSQDLVPSTSAGSPRVHK